MEDPNSDAWLPPGWTVEVRVRKSGKRDKYYFPPSGGLKFNSKVEVFRYLENARNKVSIQRISENVVVEKSAAEGLPTGWMKKTRITTKGDTIRRDSVSNTPPLSLEYCSQTFIKRELNQTWKLFLKKKHKFDKLYVSMQYYIDPVSGYAFRSIKDADRYLESGEIGRNAFKAKDNGISDMELIDDKFSSAGITMKPPLSVSLGQSSALDRIANDHQIPRSASSGQYMPMPISEHISSQFSGSFDENAQEKQLQENSETKHGAEKVQAQNRQFKNKHKKEINLPRRASKRLAGIKVDSLPELKTRNQARRDAVKQSGVEETIINADKSPNSLHNSQPKQFNALDGSETKCKSDANSTENTVENLQNGDKVDAKLDYNLDVPLKELLTDPCIAFAIQTLTGITFETSKDTQISSELQSSQHCETSASAEENGKKINVPVDDSERRNVLPSPENIAISQQHADDKANEKAGTSSEKALDISWMDPCIEFAIKTLTGTTTIPLDSDQNPKTCFQQQLSSSNNQHSEMALSSVNLDNLCQSDYSCSQHFGTQKPVFNQSFVDPTLQHPRNIGIGNSTGARFPHCGENSRNVY